MMIANFNFFLKSIYKILIISLIFSCTNKNNPLLEDWKGNYDGTPNFDLLKVEYIEGIQAVKGSTFSMQFYCVKSEHLEWIKNIGHQLVMQKIIRKFPKDWVAFATKLEFLKSY